MSSSDHPFERRPHRTLFTLSVPVFFSLIAEPITGLVDTAFLKQLGSTELAAVGVGTVVISSVFWIFNFLGIGTQTEVARSDGARDRADARRVASLGAALALGFGVLMSAVVLLAADPIAAAMGAADDVRAQAAGYLRIRGFGAPAVLLTAVCFGALRGLQDMRSPMWIAVGVNALNVLLDWLLIFGPGPFPRLEVDGAAWATVIAQWCAALWAVVLVARRLGWVRTLRWGDAHRLLVVGLDLFLRTGLLTLFILLTTRTATQASEDDAAAHQAIRNFWLFAALALDAFAASAQSLVGYFRGAQRAEQMRSVARVACLQSLVMGLLLGAGMLLFEGPIAALLVPDSARAAFTTAWLLAALFQPLNAVAFATDGIHWGTADYRFLRDSMIVSTALGALGLWFIDPATPHALAWIWGVTGGWITVRSTFGFLRIWPGFGPWTRAPRGPDATPR